MTHERENVSERYGWTTVTLWNKLGVANYCRTTNWWDETNRSWPFLQTAFRGEVRNVFWETPRSTFLTPRKDKELKEEEIWLKILGGVAFEEKKAPPDWVFGVTEMGTTVGGLGQSSGGS